MKRKSRSISLKLFIITSVFTIALISITMLMQSAFFEKFYHQKKLSLLKSNIKSLEKSYYNNRNLNSIFKLIHNFEDSNNAKIMILDSYGNPKYSLQDIDKNIDYGKTQLLISTINEWLSNEKLYNEVVKNKKQVSFEYKLNSEGMNNIVIISPLNSDKSDEDVMFVVSSLQPIGEAALVIREYYLYIYVSILVLITLLSLIYSVVISKPLRNINKVATKMSELDFSQKCNIKSNDEIGNLASTLNFLSENLNNSLNELKEKNKQLELDIEKEKSLDIMRRDFVASVSHELKTPISLVEGYAEGLKDNVAQGDERDYYLDVILDEAKRMGKLVSDMLDLSQLESGNFKLKLENIEINEVVGLIFKKFSAKFQEHNIVKSLTLLSYEQYVLADAFRIEQVIINFLTNALRHTKDGGKINVSLNDMDDFIRIDIENEGQHIEESEFDKIWERFYKIDKSGKRSLGGTGLGLAIVKNILLLHKSDFGVQNTSIGVDFYFTLKKTRGE